MDRYQGYADYQVRRLESTVDSSSSSRSGHYFYLTFFFRDSIAVLVARNNNDYKPRTSGGQAIAHLQAKQHFQCEAHQASWTLCPQGI